MIKSSKKQTNQLGSERELKLDRNRL